MPESWSGALRSRRHSAGRPASRQSRPCEAFLLSPYRRNEGFCDWEIYFICKYLMKAHKWDQIALSWNHISAVTPRKWCYFISQSSSVFLNYKVKQDDQKADKVDLLIVSVNQTESPEKAHGKLHTSGHGLAHSTRNLITFQGAPFMQIVQPPAWKFINNGPSHQEKGPTEY